jgi:predicted HicB family RNase H-like nuclease
MAARMGRPPLEDPRSETLRVRVSADERAAIEAEAAEAGETLSEWLRERLLSERGVRARLAARRREIS